MKKYTNYGFYINTYMGDMPELDFERLITRASYDVYNRISGKDYTGFEYEIQMATCSVIDILYKIEQLENQKRKTVSDKTLKSESVGDYSRTFENSSMSDIEQEISSQKQKIEEEIRKYLLWTGLLYRGV